MSAVGWRRPAAGSWRSWAAALAMALHAGAPVAALEVPFLAGHVNDHAGMLSPTARDRLEARLSAFEQAKGSQVVVLTIPTLEGESLEDYSHRVASTWRLGRGGVDDGALLLVVRDDRKLRIEVGYGLESALTDANSRQILDDTVVPRLREGDPDRAIEAGVDGIVAVLSGEALPRPAASPAAEELPLLAKLICIALFGLVIGVFAFVALVAPAVVGWLLYVFLMPFYLVFPMAMFGPVAGVTAWLSWVVAFPFLRSLVGSTPWGARLRKSMRMTGGGSGGGWSSGGWSSGGSSSRGSSGSGWSSSGGGFSGGGGSFGGGGASSSW